MTGLNVIARPKNTVDTGALVEPTSTTPNAEGLEFDQRHFRTSGFGMPKTFQDESVRKSGREVSTIRFRALRLIAADKRPQVHCLAALFRALRTQMRQAIHATGDLVERRFAEFADVPYQSPMSRQHWQDLWETESALTQPFVHRVIGNDTLTEANPHKSSPCSSPTNPRVIAHGTDQEHVDLVAG